MELSEKVVTRLRIPWLLQSGKCRRLLREERYGSPTNGYAKAYSGSVRQFYPQDNLSGNDQEGIQTIGPAIEVMAANQFLDAV